MKRLIYIFGSGRSGTTLLDIILGNSDNCFSAGELNRFAKRKGFPPKRQEDSSPYEFWNNFRNDFLKYFHGNFESLEKQHKKFEHYSAVCPGLMASNSERKEYEKLLTKFYDLLWDQVGEQIIIESSKYPFRAYNLSQFMTCKIDYIYIKRDPVHVVNSLMKPNVEQPRKGFISANMYYFFSNLYCSWVSKILRKKGFKVINLRYEDLLQNPEKVIEKLGYELNVQIGELVSRVRLNEPISTGMLFDGNRIRLENELVLNRTLKEKNGLSDKLVRFLNSPFY